MIIGKIKNTIQYIYTTNLKDFKAIKQLLSKLNFKYFTYTPREQLHKKLLLRGVDKAYTAEEVLADLKDTVDVVQNVIQFKNLPEKDGGSPTMTGNYLVYFTHDTNLNAIMKSVLYCLHHKITWSFYKKPQKYKNPQCFRCQRYGHVSKNCNMQYRCVKCVQGHGPGECPVIKGKENPKCCNCGENHPANYKGCKEAKIYTSKLHGKRPIESKSKISIQQIPKTANIHNKNPNLQHHGKSYSDIVKSNLNTKPDTFNIRNFNPLDFFNNECNSLFNISFVELLSKVKKFIPKYSQITSEMEKQMLFLNFIFDVVK